MHNDAVTGIDKISDAVKQHHDAVTGIDKSSDEVTQLLMITLCKKS